MIILPQQCEAALQRIVESGRFAKPEDALAYAVGMLEDELSEEPLYAADLTPEQAALLVSEARAQYDRGEYVELDTTDPDALLKLIHARSQPTPNPGAPA